MQRPVFPVKLAGRPIRCFLECSPLAESMVSRLEGEFVAQRRPRKADSALFRARCLHTLKVLCLNLACLSLAGRELWLQTPASKTWYAENRFWIGDHVTAATIAACTQFLVEQQYVLALSGNASPLQARRRSAGLSPGPQFAAMVVQLGLSIRDIWRSTSHDLIHLKAPKPRKRHRYDTPTARRIPFEITPALQQKFDHVSLINRRLRALHVDIKLTRLQERRMMAAIITKAGGSNPGNDDADVMLDRTQTIVYRVYNNGSFDEGGRFYGPWWQAVPKEYRKHITINGQRTIELDYSSMHPSILAQRLGIPIPDRFYEFGIGTKALVKQTFNALLNAKRTSINPIDGFDAAEMGMSWNAFLKVIVAHYEPYNSYFGSGEGLRLQRIDSDIAEAVMLRFASKGDMVLPVHDSFLCMESKADLLARIMEEEFEKQTGGRISLAAKFLTPAQRAAVAVERRLKPTLYRDYHDRVRQKKSASGPRPF